MKLQFVILALSLFFLFSCKPAENTKSSGKSTDTAIEDQLYKDAIERKDLYTMLYAINTILVKDSSRTELLDTLMYVYYELGNPVASGILADKIIAKNPSNVDALKVAAEAFTSDGSLEKALVYLERLYSLESDPKVAYRIGTIYANLGNEAKAIEAMGVIINNPTEMDEIKIEQPAPSMQGKTQNIKLRAVAHSMLGIMYFEALKNKTKAMEQFGKALQVEPNYDLAATYLLEIRRSGK